jgi:hypothetical protein
VEKLASALVDAQGDLNPHQIEAPPEPGQQGLNFDLEER